MLKIVRRHKITIDKLLFQIKTTIIEEGKKMAIEYAMNQIPTESQVIAKMEQLAKENPKEAKKYYDTTMNLLEGIKSKLDSSLIKVDELISKLESVNSKITTVSVINQSIGPLVNMLQDLVSGSEAIIAGVGSNPTTPPGPIATSATYKEKLKGKIQKMLSSIKLASRVVTLVSATYFTLNIKVKDARTKITQLIDYIEKIMNLLEELFVAHLSTLLENQDNISVLDNLDDLYLNNPGIESYLNSDDDDSSFTNEEDTTNNTTDGISNIAPRFYKQYITGSVENPNTEE